MSERTFSDNTGENRYELRIDGQTVFADYRRQDGKIFIDHVEAPMALRGTGAAGELMQNIVNAAQEQKATLVPICGYAASWLRKHTR